MKQHRERDLVLINAAGFLRSFGVGLLGVVLGIYLFRLGLVNRSAWPAKLHCEWALH